MARTPRESKPKLSKTLMLFAKPMLPKHGASADELLRILTFAARLWNAVVRVDLESVEDGDGDLLLDALAESECDRGILATPDAVEEFFERKRERWGDDFRLVTWIQVSGPPGDELVEMSSVLPVADDAVEGVLATDDDGALEDDASLDVEDELDDDAPLDAAGVKFVWSELAQPGLSYPLEAFVRASQMKDEFVPLLLASLESLAADPLRIALDPGHYGHAFAILLLGYFREPRGLVPTLNALVRAGSQVEFLFHGDGLHRMVPAALASMFDGDPEPLKRVALATDGPIVSCVRTVAVRALGVLAHQGKIERADFSRFIGTLLPVLGEDGPCPWTEVVNLISDLGLAEHRDAMKRAVEDGRTQHRSPDDVGDFGVSFEPESLDLIDDLEAEVASWPCFAEEPLDEWDEGDLDEDGDDDGPRRASPFEPSLGLPEGPLDDEPEDSEPPEAAERTPFVRDVKVGRNDPCPCGSGKKFKKCCSG